MTPCAGSRFFEHNWRAITPLRPWHSLNGFFLRVNVFEQPLEHLPSDAIPKKLHRYLLSLINEVRQRICVTIVLGLALSSPEKASSFKEFCWKDSLRHRVFEDGLVPLEQRETLLQNMNPLWLHQSIEDLLGSKLSELDNQWQCHYFHMYPGQ